MASPARTRKSAQDPRAEAWRLGLAQLIAVWGLDLVLFRADWWAMAGQWLNSSTYTHVLLVPVILVWLVARRMAALRALSPQCWWPGALGLAGALVVWLAGALAGIWQVSEFGAVAVAIAAVPMVMGPRVGVALAFPLGYMLFLVPMGDELIPLLQLVTAKLTVGLIHLSHVPASIDGVFIATPAGLFEIAEACSGVKFLIAMVALGALAANLCFVSWRRRAGFMALCVVVSVLANGVRSWATIYVAQFVGAARAGGIDHIIYGWIFFALVIALVLGVAWRFFDRPALAEPVDAAALLASPGLARASRWSMSPLVAMGLTVVLMMLVSGWARVADDLAAPLHRLVDLPEVDGWERVPFAPHHAWAPRAAGADYRLLGSYADGDGHEVDVFYALYGSQGAGRKASGYGEGAISSGLGWAWQGPGPAPELAGHTVLSERLAARGPVARLAQTTWRNGDMTTGRAIDLRLATLRERLALSPQPTMMLILSAEERPGHPAAASLAAFRQAIDPVDGWMDALAGIE